MSIYEKKYEVCYYDIDLFGKLKLSALINFLGDIATEHSEKVGIGIEFQKENNKAWVLYKWDIEVSSHISYGDELIVRTNPYSFRKFYAFRTFEVLNKEGKVVAKAKSMWLMIDIKRRRAIRVPIEICDAYNVSCDLELPMGEVRDFQGKEVETFYTEYEHIDTNNHVNNVNYITWAINNTPMEKLEKLLPQNINVIYKKEAKYKELIKVETEFIEKENVGLYRFKNEENEDLSIIEIKFSEK